jgi:hypothetical protein
MSYTDSELGGLSENSLRLCRWTGSGWSCPVRGAGSNTTTNWVCADDQSELSDWVMGTVGPTSVTLTRLGTRSGTDSTPWLLAGATLLAAAGIWMVWTKGRKRNST